MFAVTKDGGALPKAASIPSFTPFQAGITYAAPTIQSIIQSPQTDYMKSLDDIINKSMFKGMI